MNGERTNNRDGKLSDCKLSDGELRDELFFTAVRYALDELSPPARDAFEQRLLVDQQARETLAEAVAVCQQAYEGMQAAIEPVTVEPAIADSRMADPWTNAASGRRSTVWTCLALAASLLLVVGLAVFNKRGDTTVADSKPDEAGRQLAVAWVTSGEWIDSDGGRFGIVGHERRVPADDQNADDGAANDAASNDAATDGGFGDRFADDSGEIGDDFAWLEGGTDPSSSDAANDWLFEAVAIPEGSAASLREG